MAVYGDILGSSEGRPRFLCCSPSFIVGGGGEVKSMYFETGSPYLIVGIETRFAAVKERRGLIWRELEVFNQNKLGNKVT